MNRTTVYALILLAVLAAGSPAVAAIGTLDEVPAATLLIPYFEVDLSDTYQGPVTIFSVANASATAVLAHVTLWTDRGVPTLAFDIYLTGYDMEWVDLRLLFDGILPQTADAGSDPADVVSPHGPFSQDINYPGSSPPCGGLQTRMSTDIVAAIRAAHTGQASAIFSGSCGATDYGDGIARGFVTVDTVNQCNLLVPTDPTYFTSFVTVQNVLFGAYWVVNRAQNFAIGDALTAIEASYSDPLTDGAGDYTFYGRLANVNGTGSDHREGLPTSWMGRFLNGGPFNGGTGALVWRDAWPAAPFTCGNPPAGLGQAQVAAFDEQESVTAMPAGAYLPLAAQRLDLANPGQIPIPFSYGFVFYNLQRATASGPFGTVGQAVVTHSFSSLGRFAGAYAVWPLDNVAQPGFVLPVDLNRSATPTASTEIAAQPPPEAPANVVRRSP